VKLKTKITVTKEQKKSRTKLKIIIYHKFGLKDEVGREDTHTPFI
jgi:hypothetical protein